MTIKEMIAGLFSNKSELKSRVNEYDQDIRAQEIVSRKRKSAEELEYERYSEEMQKRRLKSALAKIRKQQMNEFWHGEQILEQKNIFRNHPNIFTLRRVEKNK